MMLEMTVNDDLFFNNCSITTNITGRTRIFALLFALVTPLCVVKAVHDNLFLLSFRIAINNCRSHFGNTLR